MQDRLDKGLNKPHGAVFSSPYLNFDPSILNPVIHSEFYYYFFLNIWLNNLIKKIL